jgi:FtsH-binding integral membrane protein
MAEQDYLAPGTTLGTRAPERRLGQDSRALFGHVMGLVAVTFGFSAAGAYLGRHLTHTAGFGLFIGAFACLIGLNFANRRHEGLAITLLFAFGLLMGLALAPVLAFYAKSEPSVVPQAAGATALFIGVLGAIGYAIRRDLSYLYRFMFFALLALLIVGLALTLLSAGRANVLYCVAGLAVFGGYTVLDFNRLKFAGANEVVPLAAGIFLDILNVFLFFLQLFASSER